jgi:AraC-like DNA-binding protein
LNNQTLYSDDRKNAIRVSNIQKIETEIPFSGFAAKLVISGMEKYYIGNKKFEVTSGEYILGNSQTFANIAINDPQGVKGLCVDISEEVISEVASFHFENDSDFQKYLFSEKLLVNKYKQQNTILGYALAELVEISEAENAQKKAFKAEIFYSLAEAMITDQVAIFNQLSNLKFKKNITNHETFLKLEECREFILENYLNDLDTDKLALLAGMSKYHFIRTFKITFNVTPYQLLIQKRLLLAKELLIKKTPLLQVTQAIGFSDLAAFSKAYKKYFGHSPSKEN